MKKKPALFAILGLALIWLGWAYCPPYESTDDFDISWSYSGEPRWVTFRVKDVREHPLPNVKASTLSSSGWCVNNGVTDAAGVLKYQPNECDVLAMSIEDTEVRHRGCFCGIVRPTSSNGLVVEVRVKNLDKLRPSTND